MYSKNDTNSVFITACRIRSIVNTSNCPRYLPLICPTSPTKVDKMFNFSIKAFDVYQQNCLSLL